MFLTEMRQKTKKKSYSNKKIDFKDSNWKNNK